MQEEGAQEINTIKTKQGINKSCTEIRTNIYITCMNVTGEVTQRGI